MGHGLIQIDRDKAKTALEQVEMWEHKDKLIGDLSGGQRRYIIARALATDPEIMFLDEPTTSIDQAIRNDFYTLLNSSIRICI